MLCVNDVKLAAAAYDKITCYIKIEAPEGIAQLLMPIVDTGAGAGAELDTIVP